MRLSNFTVQCSAQAGMKAELDFVGRIASDQQGPFCSIRSAVAVLVSSCLFQVWDSVVCVIVIFPC